MKKDGRDMKYVNYLCVWCLAMVLFACQEESLEQSGKTGFLVSLTDGTEVAVSRATPGELKESLPIEAKDFDLTITGSSTGETAYSGKVSEGLIPVKAGVYNLTATYGENPVLALDAPYFKGEVEKAIVRGGETTSVEIPCKVANSLLSVTFDNSKESFEDIYSDYSVEVKVGEESVTLKKDGKESAYFRAGSTIEIVFHGTLKEGGEERLVPLDLSGINGLPLQAGGHLKLTLMPELDKYDIPLAVTVAEVETATLEETIPENWLPKPKVSAEGFDESNTLAFVETESRTARLDLGLSSALQDMKLKFNFEDAQFASLNGKEYLLSVAEDKAAVEAALGITLPEIGATEAGIDLSGVVSRMQTDAGATVNNTIEVDVKANDRWSSEDENANRVYKLVCNKPEFSVNVRPENCWSREFTVDEVQISGNADAEKIKADLVYQYFDGANWVNCTTRDNVIGRTQQFVEAAKDIATKNYKVRALYRGAIASEEVEAVLETPEQLPNSGMEEWTPVQLGSFLGIPNFWNHYYYYDFLPYNSNVDTDIWWATNNERSRDYSVSRVKVTSAPCVSYNESFRHEGTKSVLIYTSGHGGGYASTSEILYPAGAFAGSLFIGTYRWAEDSEEISTGHDFFSRPSSFEFWYKYIPKNDDQFKVYVELRNGSEIISSGEFIPEMSSLSTDWVKGTISIIYPEFAKIVTSIYVQFLSTTKTSFQENDFDKNKSISFPVMGDWNAHIGSMLYIDDISLVYDK